MKSNVDHKVEAILLAQTSGTEGETPALELTPELRSLVQAIFENALENGASLEDALKVSFETAMSFGASIDQAEFLVAFAVRTFIPNGTSFEDLITTLRTDNENIDPVQRLDVSTGEFEQTNRNVASEQESSFNQEIPSEQNQNKTSDQVVEPLFDGFDVESFDLSPTFQNTEGSNSEDSLELSLKLDNLLNSGEEFRPVAYDAKDVVQKTLQSPTDITSVSSSTTSSSEDVSIGGGSTSVILTGGSGNDTITGSSSSDIFWGGAGDDELEGGDGDDLYNFTPGFGSDTITDNAGTGDLISGFTVDNLSSALQQGDDLVLQFYTGDTVTLRNHYQAGSEVEIYVSGSDSYGLNAQTSGVVGQILAGVLNTDDTLTGATGNDYLYGGDGDDILRGSSGNDLLFGATGTDTAAFTGNLADYTITVFEDGYLVTDTVANRDGANTLKDIENVEFADQTVSINSALSTPDHVTGVLYDDSYSRWNADASIGDSVTLTYSFMDALPSYYGAEIVNFTTFTTEQETAAKAVLNYFSEISNVTFTEVADTGSGGQLRFGGSDQTGSAGFAYSPSVDYILNGTTYLSTEKSGDVFIAGNQSSNFTLTDGSHGLMTLHHEIGHAMGLMHTFEGTNQLSAAEDNTQYSVMSYTVHPKSLVVDVTGVSSAYSYTSYNWNPESLMVYDIATMQYLYGTNSTTRTGDDTYTFDESLRLIETVWDAGGNDTFDASSFTRSNVIDLTPGSFSSIGIYNPITDQLPSWYGGATTPTYSGEDNVGISYGTWIENAIGGSADDSISGNYLNNSLAGGAGNDTLTGGSGDDILEGGADDDSYILGSGSGSDIITDTSGTADQISGFSIVDLSRVVQLGNDLVLNFSTGDRVTLKNHFTAGNEIEILVSGADTYGLSGQTTGVTGQIIADPSTSGDLLSGAAGNDYIFGNEGADTLQGGTGSDHLTGGAGNDIFSFSVGDGDDAITDFSKGYDTLQLDGSSFGISDIFFEAISSIYDGTNASNAFSTVIRDSNNDVYVDNNGQTSGGYSMVANIENGVAIDETDMTLV